MFPREAGVVTLLSEASGGSPAAGGGALGGLLILALLGLILIGGGNPVPTVNLLDHREQEIPEDLTDDQIERIIDRLESGAYVEAGSLRLPEYRRRLWLVPGIREASNQIDAVIGVVSSYRDDGMKAFYAEVIPLTSENLERLRSAIVHRA
jgi:hypothetical protein